MLIQSRVGNCINDRLLRQKLMVYTVILTNKATIDITPFPDGFLARNLTRGWQHKSPCSPLPLLLDAETSAHSGQSDLQPTAQCTQNSLPACNQTAIGAPHPQQYPEYIHPLVQQLCNQDRFPN